MDNRSKVISMIGMANRAQKVISGEESLRQSIREKKVKLIIIAEDASFNTKKRFSNCANYYGIPYYVYLSKDEFSISLGGRIRSVIGIADDNFTAYLEKLICETV